MRTEIFVAIFIIIFSVLAFSSMLLMSGTCDEIAHHIPVGYTLLTKWDFKMDTSQPPLSRYLVALPLKLFMKINMPDDKNIWRAEDRASFGRDFFYKYNRDPIKMVIFARLPVILVGILCGLLIFVWAKALWGEKPALFALFLYALSPDMIAHSGLATTDMVATFFIFLSCYAFWLFLKNKSFKNTVFCGICLGLAELSKYTAILLYPIFLSVLIFEFFLSIKRERSVYLVKFLVIVLLSLVITWAGYGFDFQPMLKKDTMRVDEKIELAHNMAKKMGLSVDYKCLNNFLLTVPVPLGAHLLGIMGVLRHAHEGHSVYFLGKWTGHGSPLYFLTAFLIKTPIPALIFLILGIFICMKQKPKMSTRFIFIVVTIFFVVSSFSGLKLGLRHILPIYPFCFMIAARSEEFLRKRFLNIFMWFLVGWYVISSLGAWPHYLSYFNEIIGGPKNGYRYLRDSNIDWGQDLPALSAYMRKNNIKEIALEYFGQADPSVYGVRCRKFTLDEFTKPENKVYAISAQYLENAKWTKDYEPSATAGYSIFIYDFTKKDK